MKKLMTTLLSALLIFSFASTAFAQITKDQYYARSTLSGNELEFYDSCYNGALDLSDDIDVSEYGVDLDSAATILSELFIDSPELYFIDFQKELDCLDNTVTGVHFKYNYPYNEVFNFNLQLRKESSFILGLLTEDMTEYEKVKTIYLYLGETIEYDTDSANSILNGVNSKAAMESQTIIGGLLNKKAVCSGIARSLEYMLYQIDIPCYCVIGQVNGVNHIWNILKIDGKWYYADLTKDLGYIKHNVLLQFLYDDSFLEEHQLTESSNPPLPACTSDKYMIQAQITPELTEAPLANADFPETLSATANQLYDTYFKEAGYSFILAAIIVAAIVVLIVVLKKKAR